MPEMTRMNFRERERRKRLVARWITKFKGRSDEERSLLYTALSQAMRAQRDTTYPPHSHDLQVRSWLASYPPREDVTYMASVGELDDTGAARQARLFKAAIYDLSLLIDEFGYEAVYFGVGCEAFPDAVNPWEGNEN